MKVILEMHFPCNERGELLTRGVDYEGTPPTRGDVIVHRGRPGHQPPSGTYEVLGRTLHHHVNDAGDPPTAFWVVTARLRTTTDLTKE